LTYYDVPLDEDFPGPYKFGVGFEAQREPAPKAAPWIYSHKLCKLFAQRKKDVPMRIVLEGR
jgi:hypothetical protein